MTPAYSSSSTKSAAEHTSNPPISASHKGGLVCRSEMQLCLRVGECAGTRFGGRFVDSTINNALERGGVIDITTIGARSGLHHRVEIVFHHFDGNFYITGKPGSKRDWLANMNANPDFTVHLKRGPTVDIPATAREIVDQEQRANVLYRILTESWDNEPSKAEHPSALGRGRTLGGVHPQLTSADAALALSWDICGRLSQIQSSFGAVLSLGEASPVLTKPAGSRRSISHSFSATGRCSMPFGTMKNSFGPNTASGRPFI